jgi:2-dehydro-3-deoxy-D-arabinonate dehydratase
MKICRFKNADGEARVGAVGDDGTIKDLTAAGCGSLQEILESDEPKSVAGTFATTAPDAGDVTLLAPVERQEVWAAGVTYMRSKSARMEESDFSAQAYNAVYDAERPEIFFKSLGEKVVPTGDAVGIRKDGSWNVPEPELALLFNSKGNIAGYTIGNDMSSRDIEGENLLYLPLAKVYDRAAALGPWIVLGASEADAREWTVALTILRGGKTAFEGQTAISQIKRSFAELKDFLFRSQTFPNGAALMTGTGVVPHDGFTLEEGDEVRIVISGIGELANPVVRV